MTTKHCERCGMKIDISNPDVVYVRLTIVKGLVEVNNYICLDCGNGLFALPEYGTDIK